MDSNDVSKQVKGLHAQIFVLRAELVARLRRLGCEVQELADETESEIINRIDHGSIIDEGDPEVELLQIQNTHLNNAATHLILGELNTAEFGDLDDALESLKYML